MKYSHFFFFLWIIPITSSAQELKVIRDLRFNGEIGIEKELFKNWGIGIESTLKLEKNMSRIDEIDFDISTGYFPFSFLELTMGYRLILNQKRDNTFERKHRYFFQTKFDYNIKRFRLDYRLRYQNIDEDFFQFEENQSSKNILRNRLKVAYNIRKSPVEPFFYAELFGLLKKNEDFAMKIKLAFGICYNLKKYGEVKAYYKIDRELNSLHPYTFHTMGLGYSYNF